MTYGIPETIILDNGPQMISSELIDLFNLYNIPKIHYTPRYCPQVNTVERYNKTIITAIAPFVDNDHRTWDLNYKIHTGLLKYLLANSLHVDLFTIAQI